MPTILLHLGTNQGDLLENLENAINSLGKVAEIEAISGIYQTEAWGKTDQDDFYNMAVRAKTKLPAHSLLEAVNAIEDDLGRERKEKWAARTMDIDIIAYQDEIIADDKLTIPHKYMAERNFVLVPLMEVAEDWIHPVSELSVDELFVACKDTCEVILRDEKISV